MQDIVLSQQLMSLLQALLFGACSAAAYDGVRFLRLVFFGNGRGSITAANIADILYGAAAGCAFSVFLFIANNGRFRWYLLLSAVLGFALYRLSLGKIVLKILKFTAKIFRRFAGWILKFVYLPVSAITKLIKTVAGKVSLRRENTRRKKEELRRKNNFIAGRRKKGDSG